jgi:DNA-binding NtrC family response regulator
MDKNMRLLIVDDDADDRMLFIEAVKEIDDDIECMSANDGQQALELLRNDVHSIPDLIFLDISMPRLSGKKCLSEIKKTERLKDIPVIIYTTSKDVEESKELKKMGAFHFISKPSNPEEIYYLVSFAVEEHLHVSRRNNNHK